MNKKRLYFLFAFLFLQLAGSYAQPFLDEIGNFRKADSASYPFNGKHPIVFTGSSSFRKWEHIQSDFSAYPVLNRGFGGSTLPDVIRYADDVIFKYSPKQVVIYCGENDLAASDSITGNIVFNRFKELFTLIRSRLPFASVVYVSIKPSPSRQKIQPQVIVANKLISNFLKKQERTAYVDVYNPMLNADGTMRKELFVSDDLHMNEQGYALWKKLIEPYLIR